MLKELDGYDWAEVFGEGNETGGNCPPLVPNTPPDSKISTKTFGREDVKKIWGQVEGENDERDWVVWGQLKDDRWFVARGGCDYTGWDCQASNSADVANTMSGIIRFGMTEDERERFKINGHTLHKS